ncbi:hypothetical protein BCV70DRAFT_210096 [Testicularia cyperi]|uniref:Amine oxidase domain-containing protein n=1 Tax=Testicularia cyperi TaxID=1882483 RepID=A0A317XU62_9BASI|nr:hypothetical protein BCV70DRAFT_210096 [Testicularia cyperi]
MRDELKCCYSMHQDTIRVAIIGSGLTGLVATYLLSSDLQPADSSTSDVQAPTPSAPPRGRRICVEIFERASTLGMDSASISVPLDSAFTRDADPFNSAGGAGIVSGRNRPRIELDSVTGDRMLRIDVPMRAFTGGYYPELLSLYRHLGIRTQQTNFTYSFASDNSAPQRPPLRVNTEQITSSDMLVESATPRAPQPTVLYNGANGMRGISLPSGLLVPKPRKAYHTSAIGSAQALIRQVAGICTYFIEMFFLVLAYLQLLVIALWHHRTGHTTSLDHPIRKYTLTDLVMDPFPRRPTLQPQPKQANMRHRIALRTVPSFFVGRAIGTAEQIVEATLRRVVYLDPLFVRRTLVPLFGAVMTCSSESVWQSPASEILNYVALTLGRDHYTVKDGVRNVVAALLVHLDPYAQQCDNEYQNDAVENSLPARVEDIPSSAPGKVWTSAEVLGVSYSEGLAYLDVVHHSEGGKASGSTLSSTPMTRQSSTQYGSSTPSSASSVSSTPTTPTSSPLSSQSSRSTLLEDSRAPSAPSRDATRHGGYHHLVFATQANQSARFLRQYLASLLGELPSTSESSAGDCDRAKKTRAAVRQVEQVVEVLETFKYEKSLVVNHTDSALLPASRSDWRDLNLVSPAKFETVGPKMDSRTLQQRKQEVEEHDRSHADSTASDVGSAGRDGQAVAWHSRLCDEYHRSETRHLHTMATHLLVGTGDAPAGQERLLLQTTNPLPLLMPRASTVLSKSYFDRAVLDVDSSLARQQLFCFGDSSADSSPAPQAATGLRLGRLQGSVSPHMPGIWTCGSWASGIPLLEGCVVSARLVASQIIRDHNLSIPPESDWLSLSNPQRATRGD